MDAATFLRVPQRALFASLWRDRWWCSRMQLPGHALKQGTERTSAGWVPKSLAEKNHVGWIIYGEIHVSFFVFLYVFIFQNVCFHDIKPLRSAFKLQTWTVTCSQFQHISTHPTSGSSLSWEPNNGILMMLKQRATSSNGELENQWKIMCIIPSFFSGAMRGQ